MSLDLYNILYITFIAHQNNFLYYFEYFLTSPSLRFHFTIQILINHRPDENSQWEAKKYIL